jgi:hypothetical protein
MLSCSKRDELLSESLTLNSENDWNIFSQGDVSKNDMKKDKCFDMDKFVWDGEFADGKSIGDKLIKRNDFVVKKH